MCQASVYLDQEKVMEDVIWLEPTPDGVLVRIFFEDPQGGRFSRFPAHLLKQAGLIVLELDDELAACPVDLPGGGRVEMQRIQRILTLFQACFG